MTSDQSSNQEVDRIWMNRGKPVLVDPEDSDLSRHSWRVITTNGGKYVARSSRSLSSIIMHREIMERSLGRPLTPDEKIIHLDGNHLNCRRKNLKIVSQDMVTHRSRKRTLDSEPTSHYKGVRKSGDKWSARIGVNNERIYLGLFDNEKDAAIAYNNASLRYFGPLAKINII